MQLRNNFQVRGILYDHIDDARSHNAATLIVRDNPHYHPKQPPDASQPGAESSGQ
jgi:hypothetical protein